MALKEKQPKVAMLESIRSIGYNFNSALADIIDNSISAEAKNIDIFLVESIPAIVIIDDGFGMNKNELDMAMDLGSKSPEAARDVNDLGRFGLGLKSASFSQCKVLTTTSLKNGELSSMTWDLNIVQEKRQWLIIENESDIIQALPYVNLLQKNGHGTIVQWQDFDRIGKSNNDIIIALSGYLKNAYGYLSLVFHKYLNDKKLTIRINNNEVPIIDPFLSKRHDTQKLKTEEIYMPNSKGEQCLITVTPYILPFLKNLTPADFEQIGGKEHFSSNQGFYIYRNKRLILWGNWLHLTGMNELYKNARVEVCIPNSLDDIWEVDVKKSSASIPGYIRQSLFSSVKRAIGTSKRVYQKRSNNINANKGYEVVWNVSEEREAFDFYINRDLPLLKELKSKLDDSETYLLDVLLSDIEKNIPKMKIYTSVAEMKDLDKDENSEREVIRDNINGILMSMAETPKEELTCFLGLLFQSEPYCNYIDLYDEIKEEIEND